MPFEFSEEVSLSYIENKIILHLQDLKNRCGIFDCNVQSISDDEGNLWVTYDPIAPITRIEITAEHVSVWEQIKI